MGKSKAAAKPRPTNVKHDGNEHDDPTETRAGGQTRARGTAGKYLAQLAEWQAATGGFRRIPMRQKDVRLNNWIQRARFNYNNGLLRKDIAQQLMVLGVIQDKKDGCETERICDDVYARAAKAVQLVRDLGLEDSGGNVVLSDRSEHGDYLSDWLEEIKRLKQADKAPMLLEDLRRMIPVTYGTQIERVPAIVGRPNGGASDTARLAAATLDFLAESGSLPDIMSLDEVEREQANWLIQFENGLATSEPSARPSEREQDLVRKIKKTLGNSLASQRNAQWRWWSQVAMLVLRAGDKSVSWDRQIWKDNPERHAERLEIHLNDAKVGKHGWQGGPWGVDIVCVQMAIQRACHGSVNAMSIVGMRAAPIGNRAEPTPRTLDRVSQAT